MRECGGGYDKGRSVCRIARQANYILPRPSEYGSLQYVRTSLACDRYLPLNPLTQSSSTHARGPMARYP